MVVITYIANGFFILFVLLHVWLIMGSIFYREKKDDDLTYNGSGQSDRQKRNDDYNTNYHP